MVCNCNATLNNTGTPTCEPLMSVMKKIIIVPLFDDAGVENYIDLTTTLNQAYFTARLNDSDPSQRWYPTPEIKNITSEKADSVFEEMEDASKFFIRQGIRSFAGLMPKQSPAFLGKLEGFRCRQIGVYIIDKDGNLIGSFTETGKLFPIRVDESSWNPTLVFGTDTTVQKIALGFDFHVDENDSDLRMITATDISPVNLNSISGLLDVNAAYSAPSTTSFVAELTLDYGSIINPLVVKGWVAGDFSLYNVTDSLAVTILTVTESPSGTYTFTFAAQTSGDSLRLSATKSGYDTSTLDDTLIVVP